MIIRELVHYLNFFQKIGVNAIFCLISRLIFAKMAVHMVRQAEPAVSQVEGGWWSEVVGFSWQYQHCVLLVIMPGGLLSVSNQFALEMVKSGLFPAVSLGPAAPTPPDSPPHSTLNLPQIITFQPHFRNFLRPETSFRLTSTQLTPQRHQKPLQKR